MSHREFSVDTLPLDTAAPGNTRKKLFVALAGVVLLAGAGYGTYWHFVGSHYVSTDNAYAAVEIAQVTPSVGGIVRDVQVIDTQAVKRGDVLVVIG